MSNRTPSKIKFPKLSSIPFAVVLMALAVLLMLAGVLPVRGGGQGALFRSPVFAFILGILTLSTFACCVRRAFSLRNLGFHLAHLSAVLILLGAFLGVLFEKKFDVQLKLNRESPIQRIQLEEDSVVDLGFQLNLKAFRVEKYAPNLVLHRGGEIVSEERLVAGATVQHADKKLTVARVIPQARIDNVQLGGTPELLVGPEDSPFARLAIGDDNPGEVALPDGSSLYISKAYNTLPSMQMGHAFEETAFPGRPGLILHVMASNRMAVIALPAGEPATLLSPSDPSMAPNIPELRYTYPKVLSLDVSESDMLGAPFIAELIDEHGAPQFLIENGGRFGFCLMGGGYELTLGHALDKRYEADLVITRDGKSFDKLLAINAPVDMNGWRIYLNSYDPNAREYITITLRNDPGDILVVVGILGLMIGIAIIFFVRRRKRS
jgi:hypothetical protein